MRLEIYSDMCEWVATSENERLDVECLRDGRLPLEFHNWEGVGYKTHVSVTQGRFYENWIKHRERNYIEKFIRLPINVEYDIHKATILSNEKLSVSDYEFLLSLGIKFYSNQITRDLHDQYLKIQVIRDLGT